MSVGENASRHAAITTTASRAARRQCTTGGATECTDHGVQTLRPKGGNHQNGPSARRRPVAAGPGHEARGTGWNPCAAWAILPSHAASTATAERVAFITELPARVLAGEAPRHRGAEAVREALGLTREAVGFGFWVLGDSAADQTHHRNDKGGLGIPARIGAAQILRPSAYLLFNRSQY